MYITKESRSSVLAHYGMSVAVRRWTGDGGSGYDAAPADRGAAHHHHCAAAVGRYAWFKCARAYQCVRFPPFSFFYLTARRFPRQPSSPSSAGSTTSSKTTTPTAPRRRPRGRWCAPAPPTTTPRPAARPSTTTAACAAAGWLLSPSVVEPFVSFESEVA